MNEHLPECPLNEPCDIDITEHGFCSMQVEEQFFCIHCMNECICKRLRACEQRVIDAAVQIVEELPCKCNDGADYCDGQTDSIAAIMTLAKGD